MRGLMAAILCLAIVFAGALGTLTSPARAQDLAPMDPVATLEAGDFRALAVTADGALLLVADAENNQVRIYDFSDPSEPTLINLVEMDGSPVALAGADDYALAGVLTGAESDLVQVIGRSRYTPQRPYDSINFIDVPRQPNSITLSPNLAWGAIVSVEGVTLLEMISADEINSAVIPGSDERISAAALSNDRLFTLRDSNPSVAIAAIAPGPVLDAQEPLELDGQPVSIAINPRGSLGAVLLEDNQLILFDPADASMLATFEVSGPARPRLNFVVREDAEWLALAADGMTDILLLDVTDPAEVGELGTLTLESPIRALTSFNHLIIVSDGQKVSIFSAHDRAE
jgi:hypothetical protein